MLARGIKDALDNEDVDCALLTFRPRMILPMEYSELFPTSIELKSDDELGSGTVWPRSDAKSPIGVRCSSLGKAWSPPSNSIRTPRIAGQQPIVKIMAVPYPFCSDRRQKDQRSTVQRVKSALRRPLGNEMQIRHLHLHILRASSGAWHFHAQAASELGSSFRCRPLREPPWQVTIVTFSVAIPLNDHVTHACCGPDPQRQLR
jgi:hypothetical protein